MSTTDNSSCKPISETFPYLKDLRDYIMPNEWQSLDLKEKFKVYAPYENTERIKEAYDYYCKYPFSDSLGKLNNKQDKRKDLYTFFFDKKSETVFRADLMTGWGGMKDIFESEVHEPDSKTEDAFLSFLKVVYTIGNMCICGEENFRPGSGGVADVFDNKLDKYVNPNGKNELYWQAIKDLKIDPKNDLLLMDYCNKGKVIHIWDPLNTYENSYNYFGVTKNALKESYSAIEEKARGLSDSEIKSTFWHAIFSNTTKLIVQRGYRIENPFHGKWTEEHAIEVRQAFKAVGLPEDEDVRPDEKGLRYSIIGEWKE